MRAAAATALLWSGILLCGMSLSSGSEDGPLGRHQQEDHDKETILPSVSIGSSTNSNQAIKMRSITLEESACSGTSILKNLTGLTLNPASSSFFIANNKDLVLAENAARLDGQSFSFLLLNETSQRAEEKLHITVVAEREKVLFPEPKVELSVSENAQVGQVLTEIRAILGKDAWAHEDDIHFDLIGKHAAYFGVKKMSALAEAEGESSSGSGSHRLDLALILLKPLDYESSPQKMDLKLEARSFLASNAALLGQARIRVSILNENDNLPEFDAIEYDFEYAPGFRRYGSVGQVFARDEDGDEIAFSFWGVPPPCCILEPQTGHILALHPIENSTSFHVSVAEKKNPHRIGLTHAHVNISPRQEQLSGKKIKLFLNGCHNSHSP